MGGSKKTTKQATPAPAVAETAKAATVVIADDFSNEDIAEHLKASLQDIVRIRSRWPGVVSLEGKQRQGNYGRLVATFDKPLRALFAALTPVEGEEEEQAKTKAKLLTMFNVALGDEDQGKDPGVFEVDLLLRRLNRIEAEQKILDTLDALRQVFADDILNTGAMVVEPGLKALDVARGAAGSNPKFRSVLAPLTNSLSEMTKAARAAMVEARQKAKDAEAAKAAPATDEATTKPAKP